MGNLVDPFMLFPAAEEGGGGAPTITTNGTGPGGTANVPALTDADTATLAVALQLNQYIRIEQPGGIASIKLYFNSTPDAATMKWYKSTTGAWTGEEVEVDSFSLGPGTTSAQTRTTTFSGDDYAMLKMTSGAPFPPAQCNVQELEIL